MERNGKDRNLRLARLSDYNIGVEGNGSDGNGRDRIGSDRNLLLA